MLVRPEHIKRAITNLGLLTEPQLYLALVGPAIMLGAGVTWLWNWRQALRSSWQFWHQLQQMWRQSGLALRGPA